jgi:hypothetical protein
MNNKHYLLFIPLFTLLLFGNTFAQSKKEMVAHKWTYAGIEEFGVVKKPDSTMQGDWLQLNDDGSFSGVNKGKKWSGTWTINEAGAILTFTDASSKKKLTYNLKKVDDQELVIEYQTPDLVRTRYHYTIAK